MKKQEFYNWLVEYKNLSEQTAYLYTMSINRFYETIGPLESYSADEVYEHVVSLSRSASGHNSWVSSISRFEEFYAFGGQVFDWSSKLKNKPNDKRLPKPFTEEEIDKICGQIPINSLKGRRDRAIVELLYCGLRNQEVCSTTFDSLVDGTVLVFGKGAKERYVPINDVAWNFILDYALLQHGEAEELEAAGNYGLDYAFARLKERLTDKTRCVFLTTAFNRMYPRAVRTLVYRHAEKAGVDNAHPHRFRHSFATHTLDGGLGNLTALKDVLGHTKFDMVQKYVLTTKVGRERVKSFHPRQRREIERSDV